ncbi:MAG: hypothetical protein A2X86_05370 [Bdellovibrionales bacterium GWA2_49_15]|nr:MAG: hypothetical protein A2X86_05370 [Bdellovibrionales bacterium GWA2_49_15]
MERGEWKTRVQELLNICHEEIRKTTAIGKKMLTASKTNTCLHEAYEELGKLFYKAIESGEIDWQNSKSQDLIKTIRSCQEDLDSIEQEVQRIKFAAGPEVAGMRTPSEKNKGQ